MTAVNKLRDIKSRLESADAKIPAGLVQEVDGLLRAALPVERAEKMRRFREAVDPLTHSLAAQKGRASPDWPEGKAAALAILEEVEADIERRARLREEPGRFELETLKRIAAMIAGTDKTKYPIYRTGPELTMFFQRAGFPNLVHEATTRDDWAFDALLSLSRDDQNRVIQRLASRILYDTEAAHEQAIAVLNEALAPEGLEVSVPADPGAVPRIDRPGSSPIRAQASANTAAPTTTLEQIEERLVRIFRATPRAIREISPEHRYDKRATLVITDEFDLQDLLRAFLRMEFSDLIPEDPMPKTGSTSGRIDFAVRDEKIYIELKVFKSESHWSSTMSKDVASKIDRYGRRHECDLLIFFIYDPTIAMRDAARIETDYTNMRSIDGKAFRTRMVVAPQH